MSSFLDGHVWLFERLGGVPNKLAYDNLKTAVTHVYTGRKRDLTARFMALRSHYLFDSRFCNVAKGNEKGHVENSVKRTERTYLTPIPQASNLQALNEHFVRCFERDLDRIDTATKLSYGTLLGQERKHFRTLPTKPVVVRAFVGRIEVLYEDKIIAVHDRVAPGDWSLQLEHYVTLLETKPGLLDSGKPFVKQAWTQSQLLFRNELEFRYQGDGTRRFIDILLLAKKYDWKDVCRAIDECCKNHAFNEQAVLLELSRATEGPQSPTLDLSHHPQLHQTETGTRNLSCYDSLTGQANQCRNGADLTDATLDEEARNTNHDSQRQVAQEGACERVPSLGIASSFAEVTSHIVGILAGSPSQFTS